MLSGAIFAFSAIFFQNLFNKNPYRNHFFIPETTIMNIAWGALFYAGYGLISATTPLYRLLFGLLCFCLTIRIAYLYQIRRFFDGKKSFLPISLINQKISTQQKFDQKHSTYSLQQALKILGLHASSLQKPETLKERKKYLLEMADKQNLTHPYFAEMINKACQTLLKK